MKDDLLQLENDALHEALEEARMLLARASGSLMGLKTLLPADYVASASLCQELHDVLMGFLERTKRPEDGPVPMRRGADALQAFLRVHELGRSRDRPYVGQSHTLEGERGTQTLPEITLRDLADVIGAALSTVPDEGEHTWRSWSPGTLARNVCVALEEEFPEHFPWLRREHDNDC